MALPGGYTGKHLRVDLSSGRIPDERFGEEVLRQWVGGSGVGARVLYDEVPPSVQWDSPKNRLILASGPLGGTKIMGTGTFSVITKGPLTNGAVTTQANGFLGAFLKLNGIDGLIFEGQANGLSYLFIRDGVAELRDASHLSGCDTWDTQDRLGKEIGLPASQLSVFSVGPAGEHLVKFAAIGGDRGHVAGHNGVGAVMGSKGLKAIAIARAAGSVPVADQKLVEKLTKELLKRFKYDVNQRNYFKFGTSMGFTNLEKSGALPVRNYTTNVFPEHGRFMGNVIRETYEIKRHPCWACPSHHLHMMRVTQGPATGYVGEEPEYEQWAAFGPVIGNTDPGLALKLSNEVDRLGFDTNEAGWLLGWVIECYEKGLLTKNQLDGLDMRWGNADAALALLQKVAHREGCGDFLAEGVMRAAQHVGGEAANLAIHTRKGNTPRGHDHRTKISEMLDTSTSSTGTIETGWHSPGSLEEYGLSRQSDPFDPERIAAEVAKPKGRMLFEDCLGVCRFCVSTDIGFLTDLFNAVTGWDFRRDEALGVGVRIANLLRVFNLRHGIGAELDAPSPRYSSVPADGPSQGRDPALIWPRMLARYYDLLGWDSAGRPLPATLRGLGLSREAVDLWSQVDANVPA